MKKYYTKDKLWDWERWERDNFALRRKMEEVEKEWEATHGGGTDTLEERARAEARQEWKWDVEGKQEHGQQEMQLDPALFEKS